MSVKHIAAFLIGCSPDEFMGYREYEDRVAAIGPDGKKYVFYSPQIEKGKIAMDQDQTLKEAAEASASEALAPKRRPKQRTPPTTRGTGKRKAPSKKKDNGK